MERDRDWNDRLQVLESTDDPELTYRLLALIDQDVNTGQVMPDGPRRRLEELYNQSDDVRLSSRIKRLLNRMRGRQLLGRDLLRLSTPPIGDHERRRLWYELKSLKRTYEAGSAAGDKFERQYDVLEKIDEGGMSVIFKGLRRSDSREVAIKFLKADYFSRPNLVRRFARECRLHAQFDHPNIVRLYETGQHDGCGYMILEYLPLGSLDGYLHHQLLSPSLALAAARQAAQALAYIHARDIVHRDVKLSNLLVAGWAPGSSRDSGSRFVVKLSDFGLSKQFPGDALTQPGTRLGTGSYMAPEQAESPGDVDSRADVYALAVVIYRLISKKFPDPLYRPLYLEIPGLPLELDELLQACLNRDPCERPLSAADIAISLEAIGKQLAEG